MASVASAGAVIAGGTVVALLITSALGVLALGDDAAVSLGVRVQLIRVLGVVAVTALAGGATALGGPLTFVGLAVPLMVRRIAGRVPLPFGLSWSAPPGCAVLTLFHASCSHHPRCPWASLLL